MNNLKSWVSAFRLRTLPLALASIGMGSFLALSQSLFEWEVFVLCALTTIFLQILSNLANDYGDSIHGADSSERVGPSRAVQTGAISQQAMSIAIVAFAILAFASGLLLLYWSIRSLEEFLAFLSLGILAIIAAITYTAGKKPYGYAGLGDISVYVFFGLVAVLGTFFLHTHKLSWEILLPASSCGFFAVAVLNINNIRDIEADQKAGKKSIPVRLGRRKSVLYHYTVLALGLTTALLYTILNFQTYWQFLFLLILPLLIINAAAVAKRQSAKDLDPYLRQMALTTLLFVLTFGFGLVLS